MSERSPSPLRPTERADLAAKMLKKQADMRRIADETGKSTAAAQQEAKRQLEQVSRDKTLTKSGQED